MTGVDPGVCFGFSVTENSASSYKLELIFNDKFEDLDSQLIPTQIYDVASPFVTDQDTDSFRKYTRNGYSYLHNWIANKVLQRVVNSTAAHIAVTLVPFKTDAYFSDDFSEVFNRMLPFFLLLIYILPVYRLISNVVAEKESKARETMKMMGLSDFSYWFSWWTYYFIIVTIISALCVGVLSINILENSDRGIIFLFLWIYGNSLFGMCLLI